MNRRNKFIVLFGVLTLIAIGISLLLKSRLKAPEFISIEEIQFIESNGSKAYFTASASFNNPNDFEAQILNSELSVNSNDFEIAQISQLNLSKVSANSKFTVTFKFNVDLAQISLSHGLSGIIANMLSETKEIPVNFSGYTRIKSKNEIYKIPIDFDQILKFK